MSSQRPASSARPSQNYQLDMYDDQSYPGNGDCSPLPRSDRTMSNDHERTSVERDAYSGRRWTGGQAWSGSTSREHGRGRTYQHEGGRNRSRSRSPNLAVPNSAVVLDGTKDMTQEDLTCIPTIKFELWLSIVGRLGRSWEIQILHELQLRLHVSGIEDIRLIRDRRTGQSRGFAFVQFAGIHEARMFLEQYYPTIHLHGAHDPITIGSGNMETIKVRIAYSRDKEDRDKSGKSDDDWMCEVCHVSNFSFRNLCFRCNAPRIRSTSNGIVVQANTSPHSGLLPTGDSDASLDGSASQFLLFRGLEPGANEELLAKGASKLYRTKPTQEATESRLSKKTKISSTKDASLGAKEGSIRRVLMVRDRRSGDSWRYGFAEYISVGDAQAAMTKFHSLEKFTISSKPVLVSHIHAGVFVPVLRPTEAESTKFTFSPLSNAAVRLMYWDEAAYASEFVVTEDDKPTDMKSGETEHGRLAAAARNEGLVGAGKEGEPRLKKRKVEKDGKVVAPHLQFWANQHAELHGKPTREDTVANMPPSDPKFTESLVTPSNRSFADGARRCCLLCSRQFRTEVEVSKHEQKSQLHRDNLKNDELVANALAKLKALDSDLDSSAYRDRARERRRAFMQPKQPTTQQNRKPEDVVPGADISAPVQSKGAALLGKMGWSAGEGLGAQGNGRTTAITTNIYSQGVGLGAVGGMLGDAAEEAQRQTKGSYADFLSKTKEKAKARFESLQ